MNVQNIVQRCFLFNIYKTLNNNKTIFQNSKLLYSKYDKVFEEAPEPKKKKVFIPRITLISSDESISVTTLEEAKKISTRRDLKLVKITDMDTKTQRPIYRLMTGAQYFEEDLKRRAEKKAAKSEAFIREKNS
ncbi:uncharacterized protein LOC113372460 [Ctenocephalides felis]|uniref:uncharacterized protein LOC113372460 n=1 Tax=Ctenocephalides felis TaxID=7515 RepID=UPI000E6E108A|nr:uncharacterized protein LOC113372460 [Ctenocephalides felis]